MKRPPIVITAAVFFVLAGGAAPASAAVMCGGKVATIVGTDDYHEEIVGTDRDDVIHGRGGIDVIRGRDGNDTICGGRMNNWLYGNGGRDTFITRHNWGGDTRIYGGMGNDLVDMRDGGFDSAVGGPGDDRFIGGGLSYTVVPGPGRDEVAGDPDGEIDVLYYDEPKGIEVDLAAGYAKTVDGLERLRNVEVHGTRYDDVMRGTSGPDVLVGGDGRNEIYGFDGNDRLWGGGVLRGHGGNDLVVGAGNSTVWGGTGNDRVYGSGYPGEGESPHRQRIHGGSGNDRVMGHLGNDLLDGGTGRDTAVFHPVPETPVYWPSDGFTIDLGDGTATSKAEDPEQDTLIGIENVIGSFLGDLIIGDVRANMLKGSLGDDELRGRGGDDVLRGHDGVDEAFGGEGVDTCYGEVKMNCEGPR